MMLADVRDLIKKIYPKAEHYYVGKLDGKKEKSIGVYSKQNGEFDLPVGGIKNKVNNSLRISLLVHWNNNSTDTEKASVGLFNALLGYRDSNCYTVMRCDYPIDIATDEKGIYERVIELEIYYKY